MSRPTPAPPWCSALTISDHCAAMPSKHRPDRARVQAVSALALLPEELAEIASVKNARHLFARLQRPWLWRDGAPELRDAEREALALALPTIDQSVRSADGSVKLALLYADGR